MEVAIGLVIAVITRSVLAVQKLLLWLTEVSSGVCGRLPCLGGDYKSVRENKVRYYCMLSRSYSCRLNGSSNRSQLN